MPVARTHSIALVGVEGHPVEIEADIQNGLPGLLLVGLPDTALREARDRIRAAIVNSREQWPQRRITVGLSPASLPKRGSGFDVGIAVAILSAAGSVPAAALDGMAFLGELGLDGQLRPVRGVLPAVAAAAARGFRLVAVPSANEAEAALVPGLRVLSAPTLPGLLGWLRGRRSPAPAEPGRPGDPAEPDHQDGPAGQESLGRSAEPAGPGGPAEHSGRDGPVRLVEGGLAQGARALPAGGPSGPPTGTGPDLADVLGQPTARRAAEICAAGGHHLCLLGPPGAGKTMLAERIPTLLPRLDPAAALEVTSIHSVAGVLPDRSPLLTAPPVLRPASHGDQGGDRRRRHRGDPPRGRLPGPSRLPVPGRGARVRPGRARRAPPAAGVGRGRGSPVGGDRPLPGPLHAGAGRQPLPVRPGTRAAGGLYLHARSPPPVSSPAVGAAARPGRREGGVPAGQPAGVAQRRDVRGVQRDGGGPGRGGPVPGSHPAAGHPLAP